MAARNDFWSLMLKTLEWILSLVYIKSMRMADFLNVEAAFNKIRYCQYHIGLYSGSIRENTAGIRFGSQDRIFAQIDDD